MGDVPARGWARLKRWLPVLGLLVAVALFGAAMPDLVLLFFLAVLIVYLIEPIVAGIASRRVRGRLVPRWVAVIIVYTTVVGSSSAFMAVLLPQLVREAAGLANEVPDFVRHVRTRTLPEITARLEELQGLLAPAAGAEAPATVASRVVCDAAASARHRALLASALRPEERALLEAGVLAVDEGREAGGDGVLFRVRPGPGGELQVLAGTEPLLVRQLSGDTFTITVGSDPGAPVGRAGEFDLEQALSQSLSSTLETSGTEVTEVLHMSQVLVGKVIAVIVSVFVTFLVAAFMSIDARGIVTSLIRIFPDEDEPAVHRLVALLNLGLSGVIRGQLAICVINGVLTAIGLLLLDVKFALLLATIAMVMSLIPIFGTILSSVPMVLLAMTDSFTKALLVVAWIVVIHFIEANILHPKIVGTAAKIHPVVVIFALLAGEHAAGPIGAVVAVPIASILQTLFIFFRDEYTPRRAQRPEPANDASPGGTTPGEPPHPETVDSRESEAT